MEMYRERNALWFFHLVEAHYRHHHYIIDEDNFYILAKTTTHDNCSYFHNSPGPHNCWFVAGLCGDINIIWRVMPMVLPFVSFYRLKDGGKTRELKVYELSRARKLIERFGVDNASK